MDSGSSGRLRSSREQVPAHYTSVRHSANRRETVEALHWDLASSPSQAAKRATHSLAQSTQAVQGLTGEGPRTIGRGPHEWAATRRTSGDYAACTQPGWPLWLARALFFAG